MSCGFDKELLTGYFDGELEPSRKAEVEKHISACSECLHDLGEIKGTAMAVRDLPRHRVPASVSASVKGEIGEGAKVHDFSRARSALLWVTAAAAAMLIVVNGVYFSRAGSNPPEMALAPASAPAAKPVLEQERQMEDRVRSKAPPGRLGNLEGYRDPAEAPKPAARAPSLAPPPIAVAPAAPEAPKPAEEKAKADAPAKRIAAEHYTVFSADLAVARKQVLETLKKLGVKALEGEESEVALDLTEAQFSELRKELEKGSPLAFVPGRDNKARDEMRARENRRDVASGGLKAAARATTAAEPQASAALGEAKKAEDSLAKEGDKDIAPRRFIIHFAVPVPDAAKQK